MSIDGSHVNSKEGKLETQKVKTIFSEKNVVVIHSHNDESIVIIVQYNNWEIKRVLIDYGRFAFII